MMKRAGYKPVFAGAVEAAASTGGQIMPPVMGASAFIMAEILGTPYRTIIIAALIPAFLFYISIYSAVHFRAARLGLPGLTDKDLPPGFTVWKNFHLVIPVTVIVYCLLTGFSPGRSALYASVITALIIALRSFIKLAKGQNKAKPGEQGLPRLRFLGIGDILYAMERAGKTCVVIATACVSAGIIIGVVSQSGLALRFSRVLLEISGGIPILLACFLAIAALILGVGMPTTPAYVTVSVLLVPALVRVGYLDIAAHLFALHFAVISFITPPVALAAFAAAGISGGKAMSIAFTAARIAIAGFIVPFLFLYDHSLLMKGPAVGIIFSFLCVAIAVISLASFFERFLLVPLSRWERAIALLTSIAFLLHTIPLNRIIGLVLFLAFILNQIRKKRGLSAIVSSDTDFNIPNSTAAKH